MVLFLLAAMIFHLVFHLIINNHSERKEQHTIKRPDVDATKSAIMPTISFPASSFAYKLKKLFQLNRHICIVVPMHRDNEKQILTNQ